jgi:hypothetical protein
MATTFKDFSSKKGIIAEGGDITVKGGNSVVFQATDNKTVDISAPSGMAGNYSLVLPADDGNANDFLKSDGSGNLSWASLGDIGGGTVTSVSATVPTGLTVDGVPITTSGTIAIGLASGYVIPTTDALNAKLESGDISDFITLTDLSVGTDAAASGSGGIAYDNTTGVFTYTPPDLSGYLTSETLTTLTADSTNQKLVYTDENGTANDVDLSWAIDDTNLARIASGTVDANTGIATFTRDDTTNFTVDFSALFDDTNLARITSGAVSGSTLTLTRSDSTTIDVDVSSLLDDTDTDTTYSIGLTSSVPSEVNIDLTAGGSGSGTDSITVSGSYDIGVALTNNKLVINSLDTLNSVTGRGATTTNDIGTGAITINSAAKLDASTVTATAVNSISFPETAIGAKVLLGIDDGSNKYVSELVVSHNGTDVSIAEYGQVIIGSELSFTLSGTISGGNVTISVDAGGPVKSSLSVLALL